jgi:hypothetical protein
MHPLRGYADDVQQGLARGLLVALVVVGRDEPLVAPPEVHRRPVDPLPGRGAGQGGDPLKGSGADAPAGEHHRRGPVHRLRGAQSGDQRLGDGPGQVRDVGLDDDVRRALGHESAAGLVAAARFFGRPPLPVSLSAGSTQMYSRWGTRSASPVTPVAASSASR